MAPKSPEKEQREKFRFWMEILGIPVATLSLLFVGFQVMQQQRDTELRTILEIEDSERFINELALSKPELALLMENADAVLALHAMINDCLFPPRHIETVEQAEGGESVPPTTLASVAPAAGVTCKESERLEQAARFTRRSEELIHLLPVSQIFEFYEKSGELEPIAAVDSAKGRARLQALRALVESLRARVNTAGFIFLQEFEKMYRLCEKKIMDRDFWRGHNAFEARMLQQLKAEPIRSMMENQAIISGFHPKFLEYANALIAVGSSENKVERYKFDKEYCRFRDDYWLVNGLI